MNDDDTFLWGNTCLPIILEAIGGVEGKVSAIRLHAEYGMVAMVTIIRPELEDEIRFLPHHFGTNWLSAALHAPKGLQAITVDIAQDAFTIVNCRYAPIEASIEAVVEALKAEDEA